MRFALFLGVTAIGVLAAHVVFWSTVVGALGALVILALLYGSYRLMSKRLGKSPRASLGAAVPPEILWSAFAASCMLGGGLAGMLAYNPDGYMQPLPSGPPWDLIGLGTVAGAVMGLIAVAVILLVSRLIGPAPQTYQTRSE